MSNPRAKLIKLTEVEPFVPPSDRSTYSFKLIGQDTCGSKRVSLALSEVQPGGGVDRDRHPDSDQIFFVLSGQGRAIVDGENFDLEPYSALFVPAGAWHEIQVTGYQVLRLIVLLAPEAWGE